VDIWDIDHVLLSRSYYCYICCSKKAKRVSLLCPYLSIKFHKKRAICEDYSHFETNTPKISIVDNPILKMHYQAQFASSEVVLQFRNRWYIYFSSYMSYHKCPYTEQIASLPVEHSTCSLFYYQ